MGDFRGKKILVAVSGGIIGLLFGYWFFLYLPWQSEIAAAQADTAAAQAQLAALADFRAAHNDMDAYGRELDKKRQFLAKVLPDEMGQADFVGSAERHATASGLELVSLVPGESVAADGLVALPLQLEVRGTYFRLLDFLSALERGERFVQIRQATITAGNGHGESLGCQLEVVIFSAGQ